MDCPLSVVDDLVSIVGTVVLLLGLAERADTDAYKRPTGFGFVVAQPLVVGLKRFHRAGDGVMNLGIVVFVPAPEIFVPIKLKTGDDSGPVEPGALIRAILDVGK